MKRSKTRTNTASYDGDFYNWTIEQAELLRSGKLSQVDAENVAEEIESLGHRDRRELADRLESLITELLKWQIDPGARSGYWSSNILQQRFEIGQIVEDSPSLRKYSAERLERAYDRGRKRITREMNLLQPGFPVDCPFTLEQILDEDFLPGD